MKIWDYGLKVFDYPPFETFPWPLTDIIFYLSWNIMRDFHVDYDTLKGKNLWIILVIILNFYLNNSAGNKTTQRL